MIELTREELLAAAEVAEKYPKGYGDEWACDGSRAFGYSELTKPEIEKFG